MCLCVRARRVCLFLCVHCFGWGGGYVFVCGCACVDGWVLRVRCVLGGGARDYSLARPPVCVFVDVCDICV